jgi:hypothetical protein
VGIGQTLGRSGNATAVVLKRWPIAEERPAEAVQGPEVKGVVRGFRRAAVCDPHFSGRH